uniref:hypothetical protein n=1 Tax=Agathobacter sp. TaxID=2021311 RepID=UPI004056E4B2
MNNLKEMSINMLCRFGKFGVGKSLTLGMYDFEVPKKLTECNAEADCRMKTTNNKRK